MLLADISQASDAGLIAGKMLAVLAEPTQVANHILNITASLGIAIYPEDGEDAGTLLIGQTPPCTGPRAMDGRGSNFTVTGPGAELD